MDNSLSVSSELNDFYKEQQQLSTFYKCQPNLTKFWCHNLHLGKAAKFVAIMTKFSTAGYNTLIQQDKKINPLKHIQHN